MTQPALSQLIRDLEDKVGFRVVERTTRRVILTPAGSSFLSDSENILAKLDRAIETAQMEAGRSLNSIRIGTILPVSFQFLPAVLNEFRRRYPSAAIHIETSESPQLASAVQGGSLHVALLRPPATRGALQIETLHREPFVAAMSSTNALAAKSELSLSDLVGEKLMRIHRAGVHSSFAEIDDQLKRAGADIDRADFTETTLTALALISAGDGVSLVPAWVTGLPWRELCFREIKDLSTRIDLSIAWEDAKPLPIVQHFVDAARRVARRDFG